jgi:hypothetical protein
MSDPLPQCEAFLGAIFEPEDIVEFRPLPNSPKRWGTLADLPDIVPWLAARNASGKHAYFGGNPRKAKGGSKEEDVALARCLWADFDGNIEHNEARTRIIGAGIPAPTATLASGAGIHAWWRLSDPMTDLPEWTRRTKALIAAVGSDKTIHDAPRIMRLPGFVNHKHEGKPLAAIIDIDPTRRYSLDELTPRPQPTRSMSRASREFLDRGTLLPSGGRRETIFTVACDLHAHGWSVGDAETAIMPRAQCLGLEPHELADIPRQIRSAFSKPRTPLGVKGSDTSLILSTAGKPVKAKNTAADPVIVCMADVEPRETEWLWPGRIPMSRITLVAGPGGLGKSFVSLDLAARISTGAMFPDGTDAPLGSVILISCEDDPNETIRPRLDAHRADVRKIHLLSGVKVPDENGDPVEIMFTLQDVAALRATLERVPDCKLIVIDPIGSFLGPKVDSHKDNEVRGVLAPVAKLAAEYGAAVLVVAHTRKSAGFTADEQVLGSRAFTGLARAVWHVIQDHENEDRRLVLPGKNNLSRRCPGLAYVIEGEPARLYWDDEPVNMSADAAMAAVNESRRGRPGPDPIECSAAQEWLSDTLANGPRLAKEVKDEWANGFDGSPATLKRAKKQLGVESFRPEIPGEWWWRLKGTATPDSEKLEHLEPLGENAGNPAVPEGQESQGDQVTELEPLAPSEPAMDEPPLGIKPSNE